MFRCPVCHQPLTKEEGRFVCENRHSFDRAGKSSGGYVNLLLANKKSSKDPGDNALMIAGRTAFLSAGYYQPLSDSLNQTVLSVLDQGKCAQVLDAGCGEGYYAQRLAQAAQEQGRAMDFYGIDLSKYGVKASAKRCRNVQQPVECSNFIGDFLDMAVELGAEGVLLVGNLGKLVKLAGGIMNTHSRNADSRMEILASNAVMAGADAETARRVMGCVSTDDALEVLSEKGLVGPTMDILIPKMEFHMNHRVKGALKVAAITFSSEFGVLGETPSARELLKKIEAGE